MIELMSMGETVKCSPLDATGSVTGVGVGVVGVSVVEPPDFFPHELARAMRNRKITVRLKPDATGENTNHNIGVSSCAR